MCMHASTKFLIPEVTRSTKTLQCTKTKPPPSQRTQNPFTEVLPTGHSDGGHIKGGISRVCHGRGEQHGGTFWWNAASRETEETVGLAGASANNHHHLHYKLHLHHHQPLFIFKLSHDLPAGSNRNRIISVSTLIMQGLTLSTPQITLSHQQTQNNPT